MTITTEEAERLDCESDGIAYDTFVYVMRVITAERDALRAKNARLREAFQDLLTPQTPASFAGAMIRARAALREKE
ncbi:MAG: hypothetical protein ACK5QX_11315 [bacterium]